MDFYLPTSFKFRTQEETTRSKSSNNQTTKAVFFSPKVLQCSTTLHLVGFRPRNGKRGLVCCMTHDGSMGLVSIFTYIWMILKVMEKHCRNLHICICQVDLISIFISSYSFYIFPCQSTAVSGESFWKLRLGSGMGNS